MMCGVMRFCEVETPGPSLVPEILFTEGRVHQWLEFAIEKITALIKTTTGADDAEQALKLTGNPGPHCNELFFVQQHS